MSWPQQLSRLAIGLLIAICGVGPAMTDSAEESAPPEPPPEAPQPSVEKRQAGVEGESAGYDEETAGPTKSTKGGDHQETDQRDELLILLLQILRSSK